MAKGGISQSIMKAKGRNLAKVAAQKGALKGAKFGAKFGAKAGFIAGKKGKPFKGGGKC